MQNRIAELEAQSRVVLSANIRLLEELESHQSVLQIWRSFFDLSLDLLCIASAEGRFLEVNPAFQRALGYQDGELLDRPFIEFVHPDDRAATLAALDGLTHGQDAVNFENRYRCSDGSWRWLNWTTPAAPPGSTLLFAVARDVTERKRSEAEILRQAQQDALTGLGNRAKFSEELALALARAQRDASHRVILFYLDLNEFKPINDRHGHEAGDAVLCEIARRLAASLRQTDLAARLGGDEFTVLVQGHDAEQPDALAERLLGAIAAPIHWQGQSLAVSTSLGIAEATTDCHEPTELLRRADAAMYRAKQAGGRGWRRWE